MHVTCSMVSFRMKHFCFFFSILVLLPLHKVHGSYKACIEEERKALLELKEFLFLNSDDEGSEKILPTWVHNKESFCCAWERVSCDSTTGRVTKLDLNGLRESPTMSTSYLQSAVLLNASLFLPFQELQILEIAENKFSCCVENEGLERLSSLKRLEKLNLANNDLSNASKSLGALISLKFLNLSGTVSMDKDRLFPVQELSHLRNLETLDLSNNQYNSSFSVKGIEYFSQLKRLKYLDLSVNHFNRDIFGLLGALSSLKYLSLEQNDMEGPLSNQEISKLSSLQVLILRLNNLNGELPILGLSTVRNLKILDLSENSFFGSIPSNINALTSLQALSLAKNQLNGSLTISGLCELKSLQELDISLNMFEGDLPQCLSNLSSLRVLDLSWNQFRGRISPSLITSLTSLEYIDIRHNMFNGSFQFSWITNHSRLKVLEIGHNELEIESEDSQFSPKFQLNVLTLAKCNVNKRTGNIPKFLVHQDELEVIQLSHNNLKGEFPYWLLQNKPMLHVLCLSNNSFSGKLQLPPLPHTSILSLDLSNNDFSGQLQPSFGTMLPNIAFLNLSRNGFGGMIPSSICDMRNLMRLDLSHNNFLGEVPRKLIGGCCPNLEILNLSSNNLYGEIFSSDYNLTSLAILHLDHNKFNGSLPPALSNSSQLVKLDIGSNYFSGAIPDWSRNLMKLESVIMKNNFFRGQLRNGPSHVLFLDISNNLLSEALPSQPDMQFAEHIHLQGNKFSGSMPQAFLNLSSLLTLDLRDNALAGSIPAPVRENSNLRVLLLSGNRLSGSIPDQLCKLGRMSLMDLSNNSLSGSIPRCFNKLAFGNVEGDVQVFKTQIRLKWFIPQDDYYKSHMLRMLRRLDSDELGRAKDQEQVDFVTKSRPYTYKGNILNYMSGLDLSCNNLTGEIPHELGKLGWIHALNLSHNHLEGSIPKTFSNLQQIESLDLSHNSLSGNIPSELTNLHFLEVFSVAYNNLSGKIPDMEAQFETFDNISYEGNPFLCGLPLNKNCVPHGDSAPTLVPCPDKTNEGWHETDPVVFFTSFGVSYVVFLLGFFSVLYINPYWRGRLFYLCEEFLCSCYYFVSDNIRHLQACWYC